MKNMLILLAIISLQFTYGTKDKSIKTVIIKSSIVCETCKEIIERNLSFEKGVKEVLVSIEAKTVTVKYRADKTDEVKLKKALVKLGYWADEMPGDAKAFDKLPDCCKQEGCGKQG